MALTCGRASSGGGPRGSSSWHSDSSTWSSVSSSTGSHCWLAGRRQERRDPGVTARGRGLAPTGRPAATLLAGPGRALGVDAAALQTAPTQSIRDPGDVAALASGPSQTPLDPASPPARSTIDGAGATSPDPADGSGEPDLGLPTHPG